jgi:hypothetical protein
MHEIALGMAAASLFVVLGTWISYLISIPRNKVPVRPTGSIIMQCFGIALAFSAILGRDQGSGFSAAAVIIPAYVSLIMGLLFLWLLSQRKTPTGELKVKVGDTLLPFEAKTSDGAGFHTDELAGTRVLLKFFRGGW